MTRYYYILISLFISQYVVHGVPTTAPLSLPTDDTLPPYTCNDSPTWSGPSFYPRDCATAMARFFANKLLVHEDAAFEFLAVGGQPRSGYPLQSTPLKFTYDTCTMAIVMLVAFFPEELPGVPASRVFPLVDVASFSDVWEAVKQVNDNCLSRYLTANETTHNSGGLKFRSQTGWSAVGSQGAIGVVLWDTYSPINQRFSSVNSLVHSVPQSYGPLQLVNLTDSESTSPR